MPDLLTLPRRSEVANTYDDFGQPHPERHPIDRGNIVRVQQLL
jgi:hypothetical protein